MTKPPTFTPSNWYWAVAGSTTQVYSSVVGNYVPVSNAAYLAWLAGGRVASRIASEAELSDVLTSYGLKPVASAVLDAYKTAQATAIVAQLDFRVMFNHENRLRALERVTGTNGSPADITFAQAINVVKSVLP